MIELPRPDYSRNMRLIGHNDQGGRPDGVQLMVHRGFAYIGHMVSQGFRWWTCAIRRVRKR